MGGLRVNIQHIEQMDNAYIWRDSAGLVTKALGDAAGSEKLYVNIDTVPPGAYSTKYHSHTQQEEFFLVLEGTGTLRLNGVEHAVKKGDYFAKPAGRDIAHTFYNPGSGALVILDAGTKEKEDTCYYPDDDMYLSKSNGTYNIFRRQPPPEDWTSEPN